MLIIFELTGSVHLTGTPISFSLYRLQGYRSGKIAKITKEVVQNTFHGEIRYLFAALGLAAMLQLPALAEKLFISRKKQGRAETHYARQGQPSTRREAKQL